MENNDGLTTEQVETLKMWVEKLWVLLNQDDFNHISNIFKNATYLEDYLNGDY